MLVYSICIDCNYLCGQALVGPAGQEIFDHVSMPLLGSHVKGSESNLQHNHRVIKTKAFTYKLITMENVWFISLFFEVSFSFNEKLVSKSCEPLYN